MLIIMMVTIVIMPANIAVPLVVIALEPIMTFILLAVQVVMESVVRIGVIIQIGIFIVSFIV